jgi:pyoverdine/dityrosine biosynthesis protein Dit1
MINTATDINTSKIKANKYLNLIQLKKVDANLELGKTVLGKILNYRRMPDEHENCEGLNCKFCAATHLTKIVSAISEEKPITFALPAFPAKSPNTEKVLGVLPDYAEILSLQFLNDLCEQIKKLYTPGAKIILCSDGRVFSDVVGIKESNITAYQNKLNQLILDMSLTNLSTLNLDDFYNEISFHQMRDELMKSYVQSLDFLKYKIRRASSFDATSDEVEAKRMYCGIARFLFEDSIYGEQTKSRSALQKEARLKAYEVIRRSNAWSDLIAEKFPEVVRLSIHPQSCGSKKLGIRLIANESWITPWHGVALKIKNGFQLIKRIEAEKLGAKLIFDSTGAPSHYQVENDQTNNWENTYEL